MRVKRFRWISLLALLLLLAVAGMALAAPYGSRSLYPGRVGSDVAQLQSQLNSLGYQAGVADGIFGAKTQSALTQFQRDVGLPQDGVAERVDYLALNQATGNPVALPPTTVPANPVAPSPAGPAPDPALPLPAPLQAGGSPGLAWRLPSLTTAEPLVIPAPPAAPSGPAKPLVIGYYAEDWQGDSRALDALRQAGRTVDRVVNFQLQLDASGNLQGRPYPGLDAVVRELGVQQYGLVHNYATDNFSPAVAQAVLATPESRRYAAEQILTAAKQYGLAGIDLDLENLPASLRSGYTAFVQELSQKLKAAGLGFTLSVPAKTYDDTTSNWGGAFDYQAIGRYADQVAIMAYDEHTNGLTAGAVASLPWVEKVAAYATSQIEPSKILLGIPGYGYDWVVGTTRARALSYTQAQSLASRTGAAVQWDPWAQVPYFIYWEGGVQRLVYFENAKSTGLKLDLVARYRLGGIAFWRLGLEDPATWPTIQQKLK